MCELGCWFEGANARTCATYASTHATAHARRLFLSIVVEMCFNVGAVDMCRDMCPYACIDMHTGMRTGVASDRLLSRTTYSHTLHISYRLVIVTHLPRQVRIFRLFVIFRTARWAGRFDCSVCLEGITFRLQHARMDMCVCMHLNMHACTPMRARAIRLRARGARPLAAGSWVGSARGGVVGGAEARGGGV